MRPNIDHLPSAQWTPEEAFEHLMQTFERNARQFPDLLEPYIVMMVDADRDGIIAIMRQGLRDTIYRRYPTKNFDVSREITGG